MNKVLAGFISALLPLAQSGADWDPASPFIPQTQWLSVGLGSQGGEVRILDQEMTFYPFGFSLGLGLAQVRSPLGLKIPFQRVDEYSLGRAGISEDRGMIDAEAAVLTPSMRYYPFLRHNEFLHKKSHAAVFAEAAWFSLAQAELAEDHPDTLQGRSARAGIEFQFVPGLMPHALSFPMNMQAGYLWREYEVPRYSNSTGLKFSNLGTHYQGGSFFLAATVAVGSFPERNPRQLGALPVNYLMERRAERRDWERAARAGTFEDYQAFAERYPGSRFSKRLDAKLQELEEKEWAEAQQDPGEAGYLAYIGHHPGSLRTDSARGALEELRWEHAEVIGVPDTVISFLAANPESRHRRTALKLIQDSLEARWAASSSWSGRHSLLGAYANYCRGSQRIVGDLEEAIARHGLLPDAWAKAAPLIVDKPDWVRIPGVDTSVDISTLVDGFDIATGAMPAMDSLDTLSARDPAMQAETAPGAGTPDSLVVLHRDGAVVYVRGAGVLRLGGDMVKLPGDLFTPALQKAETQEDDP